MFPFVEPTPVQYRDDELQKLLRTDFRGGLNNTDPSIMLPENQFSEYQDFQLSRQGILESRPPFRPEYFDNAIKNTAILLNTATISLYEAQMEVWTLSIPITAASGTFKIAVTSKTVTEKTTTDIIYDATAATLATSIKAALDALSGFDAFTVAGTDGDPNDTFTMSLAAGKTYEYRIVDSAVLTGASADVTLTLTCTPRATKVTTTAAHGYTNGDVITITGATGYDGKYTIENKTDTTFEIPCDYYAPVGTPPTGPVFEMKFNEAVGALPQDTSGNGNHIINATNLYGTSIVGGGKFGNALNCPGSVPGCASISDDPDLDVGTGDFSFVFWMKANNLFTTYSSPRILYKNASSIGYDIYMISTGAIRLRLDDGTDYYRATSTATTLNDNAWHHIAFTVDRDGVITLYIDGAAKTVANGGLTETNTLAGVAETLDNTYPLKLGGSYQTSNLFRGLLDGVRFYKKVLTADEVTFLASDYAESTTALGICGYAPTIVHRFQTFPCSVTNWKWSNTLFVVTATFGNITSVPMMVLVLKVSTGVWTEIFSSTTATSISVCPFKIGGAFDIIIIPNNADMERWSVGDTITTSALGLTPPVVASAFDVAGAQASGGDITTVDTQKVYYKYAYFYDAGSASTKYGESDAVVMTGYEYFTCTASDTNQKITLSFTDVTVPSGVTYVKIYRAPLNSSIGPFRYVGQTPVTSTSAITQFVDTTEFDFEGEENPLEGSNPSDSTVELRVVNAFTIGSSIIGFDAGKPNKLIYSTPGYPDVWNPLNFDYLDGTGKGVMDFNRKIYAFTDKNCYEKATVTDTAYKISNIGTIDGQSIQNVGTGIIWMDYDSIYFADFVNQYGSKGDFPKDIGHAIMINQRNLDHSFRISSSTKPISSCFVNQRYYLTYYSTDSTRPKNYVYDVDFASWSDFSLYAIVIATNNGSLWHLGLDLATYGYYVYLHNYIEYTMTTPYTGRDYRDHRSITGSTLSESADIPLRLKKEGLRLGGDFVPVLVNSLTLALRSLGGIATVTLTGLRDPIPATATKTFTATAVESYSSSYNAVWGVSKWASSATTATEAVPGWRGIERINDTEAELYEHYKITRGMKAYEFSVLITFSGARGMSILLFGLYYKLLPSVA